MVSTKMTTHLNINAQCILQEYHDFTIKFINLQFDTHKYRFNAHTSNEIQNKRVCVRCKRRSMFRKKVSNSWTDCKIHKRHVRVIHTNERNLCLGWFIV